MRSLRFLLFAAIFLLLAWQRDTRAASDPIMQLQSRMDAGKAALRYDPARGYLPALLKELRIPVDSQGLVFSKTSFQAPRISPGAPRAIYFNDDVYVGSVQGGEVLEIAAVAPGGSTAFYTLPQRQDCKPRFVRQDASCTQCHQSPQTADLPGLLMRSVFPDSEGRPIFAAGTYITTDQSPFKERWGGWYTDGKLNASMSMANRIYGNASQADDFKSADLKSIDLSRYLGKHSDVVAIAVLAHQTHLHNLISQADIATTAAIKQQVDIDAEIHSQDEMLAESTRKRIAYACEPVVRAMLFSEESFSGPVTGSSDFSREFESLGPRDHLDRSLRDFDLKRRLFQYPCSYLIYSEQFNALPDAAKRVIYRRLWQVLTGRDASQQFNHLSDADCDAIYSILLDTKPDLPAYWKRRK